MLDIGTGDGMFVYRAAIANARKFFIGIDPNRRPLEKISERIYRKASRGGAPNALFVQAAVEDLPPELAGIASEVHVNFPWGSLLRTVAGEDINALRNLRMMCSEDARFKVILGVDPARDKTEIARLQIPQLSLDYIDSTVSLKYQAAGLRSSKAERWTRRRGVRWKHHGPGDSVETAIE